MGKSGVAKTARKISKGAKKQMKSLPGKKSKSPLSKVSDSLPTGGGVVAGIVGTYVMRRVAQGAKDRVKSLAGGGSDGGDGLADTAQKLVSGSEGGKEKAANVKLREIIQEYIDVAVSREFAYNAWKDYESLNEVFKGVQWVQEEDDGELKWVAKIGPSKREWGAEVKDDVEARKIGWESTGGEDIVGVVTFHELDQNLTHIMVQIEYHPKGALSSIANLLRIQRRRVRRDLRLFKHYVELKAEEDGEKKTKDEKDDQGESRQASGGQQTDGESRSEERTDAEGDGQGNGRAELEKKNVDDLRKVASVLEVEGYNKMNKGELIDALEERTS
jgi:uncharacterized membrane protein